MADRPRSWGADAVAGLSIAGLLLPEAVAYSGIANLPPQAGLIGLVAGLALYGLIGTSRFAIVSATSSSAAVLGAACASLSGGDLQRQTMLAAALVLITGGYFMLAGAARLGSVTDFISKPVLRGFTFALALVIALRQLGVMAGVHVGSSYAPVYAWELVRDYRAWNAAGLATGGAALALLLLLGRLRHVPGGLIVIALGIGASGWLDLRSHGVEVVGPIHFALHAPGWPQLPRADWLRLAELGVAMVLVLYSESYGSIRSFAIKHGDNVSANRDLVALGASNALSGLFLGMPVGAGYSATSANEAAGATTRLAGAVALAVMMVIVALVLPRIADTPQPVLAAIVIAGVSHSLRISGLRPYFAWRRDRLVLAASVVAVLWLGVLDGLLAGVAISLVMLLRRFSQSVVGELGRLGEGHDFVRIADHPDAQRVPGIIVLRPEEPLFFANVDRILGEVRRQVLGAEPPVRALVLSLEETFDLDGTTIESLTALIAEMRAHGRPLVLARLKHPVHQLLDRIVGPDRAGVVCSGLSVDDGVQLALAAL